MDDGEEVGGVGDKEAQGQVLRPIPLSSGGVMASNFEAGAEQSALNRCGCDGLRLFTGTEFRIPQVHLLNDEVESPED